VEGSNGSQYLYTHEIGEYEPHYRQLQIIHAFIQKEYRIRRKNIVKMCRCPRRKLNATLASVAVGISCVGPLGEKQGINPILTVPLNTAPP